MTTEIAVSNKLGVALATDSAVTISSGSRVKVFNTADKLFELSDEQPVALMINGNMDCMGIPWEILVKDFRQSRAGALRDTIEDWSKDLIKFIETNPLIDENISGGYIENVTIAEISEVQNSVMDLFTRFIFRPDEVKRRKFTQKEFDVDKMLDTILEWRRNALSEIQVSNSLSTLDHQHIATRYREQIIPILKEKFRGQDLTETQITKLISIVVMRLIRDIPSDFSAGIVIAGFGTKEIFPSICAFGIDGKVAGILKASAIEVNNISESSDGGQVISFAQTDVIERLLKGVDDRFVEKTTEFLHKAVISVARTIDNATRPHRFSKKRIEQREKSIKEIAEIVADEFYNNTAGELKNEFAREFDRMVAMMPKQELIEFAEALVSITAVERKATTDAGTVGGPIDMGFITKNEGFVWIKRKHYFDKDINPRYFWRHFSTPRGQGASP